MKRNSVLTAGIICALTLVFAGTFYGQKVLDKTVAIVNNEQILLSEYQKIADPMVEQWKTKNEKENPDWSADKTAGKLKEFKNTVLEELVNNKLIVQEAVKAKKHASRRQVDEQLDKIKKQFTTQKEFQDELVKQGLTEASFRKRIEEQLIAEELTYEKVKAPMKKATPKDIDDLLAVLKKKLNDEEVKGLSEQEEQGINTLVEGIKNYMDSINAQDEYQKWIKALRAKSKIKINPIE
jgi:hypothetical protein